MMATDVDTESFRAEARAWIEANLERRPTDRLGARIGEYRTPEDIAATRALQRRLFEGGFAGLSFPTEYGGRGLTLEHERTFSEEARDFVTPDLGGATLGPIARAIVAHASPDFCQRHIPRMLSGDELWCQFSSEPEAGSDLAGVRTSAIRDGERWILNGSKIWTTGAYYADFAMCMARTDWSAPKHQGLTWFAVSTAAEGLTIQGVQQIDGMAAFCQEFLDGVEVADEDVIGEVNRGWTVFQTMLIAERGAGVAVAKSLEPRALAPDLLALMRKVGRTDDPVARQLVARAHINDYVQYQLGEQIAQRLRSTSKPPAAVAAYGKLAAGTLAPVRAQIAAELGGPEAFVWDADDREGTGRSVEFLKARMLSIAGGTNEMQRNGIGERILGLPKEPSFDSNKAFSDVIRDARTWTGRIG